MDFVTIEYSVDDEGWIPNDVGPDPETGLEDFAVACEKAGLQWEHLDKLQRYCFKVVYVAPVDDAQEEIAGLRFLGVEARWGEFVPATPEQLVLRNPS